jgi:ubiquinone/menaquinone biosynthesis C-methylase UbiE
VSSERPPDIGSHDWRSAGEAWGRRALVWAYLCEGGAGLVYDTVLRGLGCEPGDRLLDVGCGAGGAARLAASQGVQVVGIDASAALLDVARKRSPEVEFRQGSMFDLPFDDAGFDAAVSFNGIFGGGERALAEMRRVVRPGGRVALTFWGSNVAACEHLGVLIALSSLQRPSDAEAGMRNASIGEPGVAEAMLTEAAFSVTERGIAPYVNEWPTIELAIEALASSGPAAAALERAGPHHVGVQLREAIEPFTSPLGDVRLTSEWDYVIADVPING